MRRSGGVSASGVERSTILRRFEENGLEHDVLELEGGAEMIVSERDGRIFGPFWGGSGESLFWVNPVFLEPRAFKAFLAAEDWNLCGERVWIAPEIQFHVADRRGFWGT